MADTSFSSEIETLSDALITIKPLSNKLKAKNAKMTLLSSFHQLELAEESANITDLINKAKKDLSVKPKDATSKFSKKDITKLKSIKTLLIQILKSDTANTNRIQLMENSLRLSELRIFDYRNIINNAINRVPTAGYV